MINKLPNFIRLMILALGVGLMMGVISTAFLNVLEWATVLRTSQPLYLLGLPFLGVLTLYTYQRFGKNAHKGNDLIIDSIHTETQVPLRMAILTFVFTVSTHVFGGSAGREGTGVQIGGTLSNALSSLFKLDKGDQRILVMAGISAGFGSVFGTPLAGAFFGMEMAFIGKLSTEALIPCFIAAYTASTVTLLLGITHTVYSIKAIPALSPSLIVIVILACILFGLTGRFFSQSIHFVKDWIARNKLHDLLKAFLGGSLVIGLMLALSAQKFAGLSTWLIQAGFDGTVQFFDPVLKFLLTVLTLGTGFQGGEVTPLFGIGSSLGGLIGQLSNSSPSLLAALGLIAVFGCAANTPLTTVMLGIELFGFQATPFYLIAALISYYVAGHHGIYGSQIIHFGKRHPVKAHQGKSLRDLKKKTDEAQA
jgi:H+/Cl- antiporter ClcA